MTQFESNIKYVPYSQERVYEKLSDLTNLSDLAEKLEGIKSQLDGNLEDLTFDQDSLSVKVQGINLTLRIIEREPCKCIKFEGVNTPIPINLWIQVLPNNGDQAKMKLTVGADMNMFLKPMLSKPLKEGVEKLADLLTIIQY